MKNEKLIEKIVEFGKKYDIVDGVKKFIQKNRFIVIRGEVFITNNDFKDITDKFYLKIIYIGKKIGRLGNEFYPNISFFEEVFKFSTEEKRLELPYKKAWLFCCGRDLFIRPKSQRKTFFITYRNEFIGFGVYDKKKKMIKNISDIGIYIRNQAKL